MTFAEYHATMTKKMPDAVLHPEMYNLCYELMKKTWEVAYGAGAVSALRGDKFND